MFFVQISVRVDDARKAAGDHVERGDDFLRRGGTHDGVAHELFGGFYDAHGVEIFGEDFVEFFDFVVTGSLCLSVLEPAFDDELVAEIGGGDVDLPAAGDGGGGGVVEVLDFEDHFAVLGHGDTFAVGEGEDFVVVEDGVQVLDPNSV